MTAVAQEHPLLFKRPMILAMQLRTKTVTRRPIKPQPVFAQRYEWKGRILYDGETRRWFWRDIDLELLGETLAALTSRARWKPGHLIWGRETWRQADTPSVEYHYRADPDEDEAPGCWKPSIFMPRSAARFLLPVVSARAELLSEITVAEALAEGIPATAGEAAFLGLLGRREAGHEWDNRTTAENYLRLWDRINPDFPAASNPFVWRIEYQVPHGAPRWPRPGGRP